LLFAQVRFSVAFSATRRALRNLTWKRILRFVVAFHRHAHAHLVPPLFFPGGFLDQSTDYLGEDIKRGKSFTLYPSSTSVKIGMVYTPDLAQLFCDAIELPEEANGKSIDVGWSRPVSFQEVVSIVSAKLNRKINCYGIPRFVRIGAIYTVGWFSPFATEMLRMFNYFDTGLYVNDPEQQKKYFGVEPPTPEDVIGRYVDKVLKEKEAQEAETTN